MATASLGRLAWTETAIEADAIRKAVDALPAKYKKTWFGSTPPKRLSQRHDRQADAEEDRQTEHPRRELAQHDLAARQAARQQVMQRLPLPLVGHRARDQRRRDHQISDRLRDRERRENHRSEVSQRLPRGPAIPGSKDRQAHRAGRSARSSRAGSSRRRTAARNTASARQGQ